MLSAAAGATNGQNPDAVVGAAHISTSVAGAVHSAQAMSGLALSHKAVKTFEAENQTNQEQGWKGMSNRDRQALLSAGYKPPGDESWWARAGHALASVGNSALNALGAPQRLMQHGWRTLAETAAYGNLTDPHDWAHYWNVTSNGEKYLDPTKMRAVEAQYDPKDFNLALKMARGQTPQQILAAYQNNSAKQQQLAKQLQSEPVLEATAKLNAAHVSIGRTLASAVGLKPGSTPYTLMSGGLDAFEDFFGDPTILAGKFLEFSRGIWYAVRDGEDVEKLFQRSISVRRGMTKLADTVRDINEGEGMAAYDAAKGVGRTFFTSTQKIEAHVNLINQLHAAEADTTEKVLDWFKNERNLAAWIEGSGFDSKGQAVLPRLTLFGAAKTRAGSVWTKALNWADKGSINIHVPDDAVIQGLAETPGEGAGTIRASAGRFFTHLVRLMPKSQTFNPNDPAALQNLRDIASTFLAPSDVDKVLHAFITNPSLGARWKIYRSLMETLFQHAGFTKGSDLWDEVAGKYVSDAGRSYAVDGLDKMTIGDEIERAGLLKSHMNEQWLVPSYKTLSVGAKKTLAGQSLRLINNSWADKFMAVWRPLTLARTGFATRVGGEEGFGFMLREGVVSYLRAIAANMDRNYLVRKAGIAAKEAIGAALDEESTVNNLREAEMADHGIFFKLLTRNLTQDEIDKSHNVGTLLVRSLAKTTSYSMNKVGHALTFGKYEDAVRELIARDGLGPDSPFSKYLTALHYDSSDTENELETVKGLAEKNGKLVNAELKGTGRFAEYGQQQDLYKIMWQRELHRIASDDWSREALLSGRSNEDKAQKIADILQDDPMWKMSVRSQFTHGGDKVGDGEGEITERAAAEDHARQIVKYVDRMTRSPKTGEVITIADEDGNEIPITRYMLEHGESPRWYTPAGEETQLAHVRHEDMPTSVSGPEKVPMPHSINPSDLTNKVFEKFVSPQINWISRQPMFIHYYADGKRAFAGLAERMINDGVDKDAVDEMISQHAMNYALSRAIPYVHNPELKSMMSQVTRNLAPFWFAQEQFYKRWARTFYYSPEAFRRAELIVNGLQHVGFLHTDPETGSEYFVYPGSAAATDALTWTLGHLGLKVQMPVHADMIGEVDMLSPGLDQGALPSWGPLMVLPMDGIRALDPSMTKAINTLEGNASSSTYFSAVLPSDAMRILDAVSPQVFDESQFASAQMSAIQYLEVTGHGLGTPGVIQVGAQTGGTFQPPANAASMPAGSYVMFNGNAMVKQNDGRWVNFAQQSQTFLNRVRNWTRIFFTARALYGFSGPASPEDYFDAKGLNAEYEELLNEMPYQNALAVFMAQHPDATAITVGQTTSNASGLGPDFSIDGYLPATQAAMNFIAANPQLVQQFPGAAAYFIPEADTAGKFDLSAYQEQMQEGFRQQRTPQQFLDEVTFQNAANYYYQVEDYKNKAVATGKMSKDQAYQLWTQFTQQFNLVNPLFAAMNTGQGSLDRAQIMGQVGQAISSGVAPQNQQTAAISVLYQAYMNWYNETGGFGQSTSTPTEEIDILNQDFAQWVSQFAKEHPSTQPLIQRVIAPALASTLTDMAAQGQAVSL